MYHSSSVLLWVFFSRLSFFRYMLLYLWSTQCKLDWMQLRHLAPCTFRITTCKCLPNKTSGITIGYWVYINSYLQFWSCKRFLLHICCYWLPWRFLLRIVYHAFESRIKKMINYMYLLWSLEENNKQNTIYALSIIYKKKIVNKFIEPLRFWSGYNFLLLIFRKSPVSENNTVLRPRIWIATLDLSTNILLHKCFWWVIIWYQDKDIWIFWMSPFKKKQKQNF